MNVGGWGTLFYNENEKKNQQESKMMHRTYNQTKTLTALLPPYPTPITLSPAQVGPPHPPSSWMTQTLLLDSAAVDPKTKQRC